MFEEKCKFVNVSRYIFAFESEKRKSMGKLEKCLYIVELLSHGRSMSLREINEHWKYSSFYDGELLPKSFGRYKEYVSAVFAIDIECDKRSNTYYIANPDYIENNALYKYLLSAFHVEALVELAMKHKDCVVMEDAPSGVEYLQLILKAIDQGVVIEFDYHSFNKKTITHQLLIPCFLKVWESRWYLIAEPLSPKTPTVYALERISNLHLTEERTTASPYIKPNTYFEACFGVNHEDCIPQLIKLKVYGSQVDYIKARPLHESQKEIEVGDGWSIFSYWLRPSYNFYQAVLWHREKVEVLEPEEVRNEVKGLVEKMRNMYL